MMAIYCLLSSGYEPRDREDDHSKLLTQYYNCIRNALGGRSNLPRPEGVKRDPSVVLSPAVRREERHT